MKLRRNPYYARMLALYVAILLLLCLAIWSPGLSIGNAAIDLMLVLDESESIDPASNNSLWQRFMQQAGALPGGSRISLIRFADRASVEVPWTGIEQNDFVKLKQLNEPPRHRYLDPGASDIRTALDTALRQTSINRRSVILISSDGVETIKPPITALPLVERDADFFVFYHQTGLNRKQSQIRIESVNMPQSIAPGQLLPLSIAIESSEEGRGSIDIRLDKTSLYTQELSLSAGARQLLYLQLPVVQSGTQKLQIISRDDRQDIVDKQTRLLETRNTRKLLYIGKKADDSDSILAQLQGWDTLRLEANQLPYREPFFEEFDVVILDDIAATSINAAITRNLKHAIQYSATALIVLGGPHSFASGAYRHSDLEELLPVNAETSRRVAAAAFLFLLDKSGSMDASSRNQNRLADALRAVSETAKSIRGGDETAVLAFDREVRILLPLQKRADLKSELGQAWQIQASGGTLLTPALNQSITLLANSESAQRFLILVTDGFVKIDDIKPLTNALHQANIRLVALAIGDDANLDTLKQLSAVNNGRVLQIDDTAQLPRFMREQLEITQQSWNDVTVSPEMVQRPPFIGENVIRWKNLQGYQITRAKPLARVYLSTVQGDPLLAVAQFGAGRVAALPGGMLESQNSGNLLPALLNWMNSRQQNPNLDINHSYVSAQLTLLVDAVAPDQSWQLSGPAQVTLTNPAGVSRTQPLQLIAPGRFSTVMPAPQVGVYRALLNIANQQIMLSLYLENDAERRGESIAAWLQKAIDNGDIQPWTETALKNLLSSSTVELDSGPWLLLLAFLSYLGLIALQYPSAFHWLKKALTNPR